MLLAPAPGAGRAKRGWRRARRFGVNNPSALHCSANNSPLTKLLTLNEKPSKNLITNGLLELQLNKYRPVVPGGAGVVMAPPDLEDQLTLSEPRVDDYAHLIILSPPDFQTFQQP